MALSNAQAAKRALHTALKAATYTDPQPGVWHSSPNVDGDHHDNIIVGPTATPVTFTQEWLTMAADPNARRRREELSIPVQVRVFREGTDEFDAEDRAWHLAAAVAAVLAADQTLAGTVKAALPAEGELAAEPFEDGRMVRLTLTVTMQSFVTGI